MTPAERARAIVDQHLWPTREGPFVRVNDQPRDLEHLIEAIAAAQAAQTRKLACPTHEPILRDSVEAKSCCALGFTVSFWDRKYCEVADELEREAAQTRALDHFKAMYLKTVHAYHGERGFCAFKGCETEPCPSLRAALTGAPREPHV